MGKVSLIGFQLFIGLRPFVFLLKAVLEDNSGMEAVKTRGLKVLRATVTKNSRLVGQTAVDVQFNKNYKAAIVAVQQGGKNATQPLSTLTFGVGDVLVLQVSDDCPLLAPSQEVAKTSFLASMSAKPKSTGQVDPEVRKLLIIVMRW